jgi:hypothetical protein
VPLANAVGVSPCFGGGPPPLLPSQVTSATLRVWVEGDSGLSASQWTDQSGNNNHFTQATGANQPTVVSGGLAGKNTLRFDGVNDYMDTPNFSVAMPMSVFVVVKSLAVGAAGVNDVILDAKSLQFTLTLAIDNRPMTYLYAGTALNYAATPTSGAWQRVTCLFNTTSSSLYVGGGLVAGPATIGTPAAQTGLRLCSQGGGTPGRYTNTEVAAVLAYSGLISAVERAGIERYLTRWAA